MIKRSRAPRLFWKMLAVVLIGTGASCPQSGGILEEIANQPERFFLAFAAGGTSNVQVRYSEDGTTWQNGSFPMPSSGNLFHGVGAMADPNGVLHIVLTDRSSEIDFQWGFGPAAWDNRAVSQASHPSASAPTGAYIGDSRWLVAFRRGDNTVAVSVYDTQARAFIIAGIEPLGLLNTNVEGRPSIVSKSGTFLLVWRRWDSSNQGFSLITALGQVQNGIPTFSSPTVVPVPSTSLFRAGIESDPDATHDHSRFYIAFVREELSTGQAGSLHGFGVEVFFSTDGQSWQSHSTTRSLRVVRSSDALSNQTFVNIAAISTGTLLMAAVRGVSSTSGVVSAVKFSNGQWSSLNDQQIQAMFGATNAFPKQFSLIRTGKVPN